MPNSPRPDSPLDRPPDHPIEHPRTEPEVLPPLHASSEQPRYGTWTWISVTTRDGHRHYRVSRPGTFASAVLMFAIGATAAVLFTVAFATALIVVPLIVLAVGLLLLSDRIKSYLRKRQR